MRRRSGYLKEEPRKTTAKIRSSLHSLNLTVILEGNLSLTLTSALVVEHAQKIAPANQSL